MSFKFQLHGIIPPLATPLDNEDALNVERLHQLIDHIIAGGVNGVFVLGTTGEAPSLSLSLKKEIIAETCRYIDHKIPVLVGITDSSWTESLIQAKTAAHNKADAVVASSPFYYPISQDDLYAYIKRLADEVPLPLYLYNIPGCTKTVFEIETLKKLTEIPNIVGVKDSSGNMVYLKKLIRLKEFRPDWSVFVGPEELLAEAVLSGADGGVNGGANLYPQLYVDLYDAAVTHDVARIQAIQDCVMDISESIYTPVYLPGLKYALSCKNLSGEFLAPPLQSPSPEHKKRIREFITKHPEIKADTLPMNPASKKKILNVSDDQTLAPGSKKEVRNPRL